MYNFKKCFAYAERIMINTQQREMLEHFPLDLIIK